MGLPGIEYTTVVLNDPGRLISVHCIPVPRGRLGWFDGLVRTGDFQRSDFKPMWRQGMFVLPFMARLVLPNSVVERYWRRSNRSVYGHLKAAAAHIILSGWLFLAAVWHWVYWDLELLEIPHQ